MLLVTDCFCIVKAENADSELNLSQDEVLAQVHIPNLVLLNIISSMILGVDECCSSRGL